MKSFFKRFRPAPTASRVGPLLALVVSWALIGIGTQPASAQDAPAPGGVQFLVTPYLWLAGINATIQNSVRASANGQLRCQCH